jgi:hypothetical protein
MRRLTAFAILTVLALPRASTAAESAAAALAAQAPTDWDQCQLLQALCHAAVVAVSRANGTPGTAEILTFSQEGKAELAVRDARDAARVIEQRHGGKRLPCFDHPECAFLGKPGATAPPTKRTR